MKRRFIFIFLFFLFLGKTALCGPAPYGDAKGSASSPPPQERKEFLVIRKSFESLARENFFHVKMQAVYRQTGSNLAGSMILLVQRKPVQAAAKVDLHAELQGMKIDFQGEGRNIKDVLYFVLNQSPFGKPEDIGQWFALDLNELDKIYHPKAGQPPSDLPPYGDLRLPVESFSKPLDNFKGLKDIKEEGKETVGGVVCRHFVAVVPLDVLLQFYASELLKKSPDFAEKLQLFLHNSLKIPPVSAHFWIGASDGKLHQILIPFEKSGSLKITADYKPEKFGEFFSQPDDAADARALGLLPPWMASKVFQPAIAAPQKEVKPVPGTALYFQPVAPYSGPSLEKLKEFCAKEFGLESIEILPEISAPDKALNTIRLQYSAEELLDAAGLAFREKQLEAPSHYLVVFADQDLYSSESPGFAFVAMLMHGSSSILSVNRLKSVNPDQYLSRTEKLLARDLGFMYWKLETTTLPQDPMCVSAVHIPEDLDQMQEHFLEDKSMPLVEQGIALEKNDPEKARDAFLSAIQYNPLNPKIYFLAGQIDYNTGKYEEAGEVLNKALLLDSENDDAYYLLGSIDEKLGQTDRAIREYQAVHLLNSKRSDAYYRLSEIYGKQGKEVKAKKMLETAKELEQENRPSPQPEAR